MNQKREGNLASSTFGTHQYGAQEAEVVAVKLSQKLGPEFISTRSGPGGSKVSYLEGWKATNLANEIFGFNGWSHSVVDITVDFVDVENGKVSTGISSIVRVTLKDGTFHEDVGYGSIDNARSKSAAFEKAKKESITDATKRALKHFGNSVGACLYDKDYLRKVSRITTPAGKPLDPNALYRHAEFKNTAPPAVPASGMLANSGFVLPAAPHGRSNVPMAPGSFAGAISKGLETPRPEYTAARPPAVSPYGDDDGLLVAADLESVDSKLLMDISPDKTNHSIVGQSTQQNLSRNPYRNNTGNTKEGFPEANNQQSMVPGLNAATNPQGQQQIKVEQGHGQHNTRVMNQPVGGVNASDPRRNQPTPQPRHEPNMQGDPKNGGLYMPLQGSLGNPRQGQIASHPNRTAQNMTNQTPHPHGDQFPPHLRKQEPDIISRAQAGNPMDLTSGNNSNYANLQSKTNGVSPKGTKRPLETSEIQSSRSTIQQSLPASNPLNHRPGFPGSNSNQRGPPNSNAPIRTAPSGASATGNMGSGGYQYANPVMKRSRADIPGFT